jgi:ELWxxDGT repeat protein
MTISTRSQRLRKTRRRSVAGYPARLFLEVMEDRTVPAQIAALGPNNLNLGDAGPTKAAQVGNTLYFIGSAGANGPALWQTDGTTADTAPVGAAGLTGLNVTALATAGNSLYFTATAGPSAAPNVYKLDATAPLGVTRLTDLGAGPIDEIILKSTGSDLLFEVDSPSVTPTHADPQNLWVTDGTLAGTQHLGLFVHEDVQSGSLDLWSAVQVGSRLYFIAETGDGAALWTSDGTSAGTYALTGQFSASPDLHNVQMAKTAVGPVLFATDAAHGDELWSVNGDSLTPIAHLDPTDPLVAGANPFLPATNTPDGRAYFLANDGSGRTLWATDGTAAGTQRIVDPNTMPTGFDSGSIGNVATVGGTLEFTSFDKTNGDELWTVGSTGPATAHALHSGPMSAQPHALAVTNSGLLLFTANADSFGTELWSSDGSSFHRLTDLDSGPGSSEISSAFNLGAFVAVVGTDTPTLATPTAPTRVWELTDPTAPDGTATTTTLTVPATTATTGNPVTLTAKVSSAPGQPAPTGSVVFRVNDVAFGEAPLVNGTATFSATFDSPGLHSLQAVYTGDSTYDESISATTNVTANTGYSVALTTPQKTTTFGSPVTLTAHVAASVGNLPAGAKVQFRDGTTPLGSVAVNASGDATLTVSMLGAGTHNITAVFTAGTDFTSPALGITVQKAATTASARSTASTAKTGDSVTLSVTIAPTGTNMPSPTGTVMFKDGATILGTAPIANGRASVIAAHLIAGTHPITAVYQGDANYLGSSAAMTQTITGANIATTIALQTSDTSVVIGQSVTLRANVTPAIGATVPTGAVTFKDGNTVIGTALLDRSGQALLNKVLPTGSHSITASFAGSGFFGSSTSAATSVLVRLGSQTTMTSSAAAIVSGQGMTLTATVAPAAPGGVQPAGSVTFFDGSTAIGTAAIKNGIATVTTGPLVTVGIHKIYAAYTGNPLFNTSSSGGLYVNVRADGTATTLQSPSAVSANGMVTLSANIAVIAPGTGTATGKVTFMDGNTALGTANVTGGKATLTIPKLAAGSHYLRAVFNPTSVYAGSSSALMSYKVAATTATVLDASSAVFGQTTTLKATVAVLSPGFGKASGKVTFKDGSTVLGSATLLNGVATLGVKLPTGGHALTASFDGSGDFATSASTAMTYAVTKATPVLTLGSSPANPTSNAVVTLKADAGPATLNAAKPTGLVTIKDGTVVLGAVPLSAGPIVLAVGKLTKGTHALTMSYVGDTNYLASTANLTLTIG